MKGWQICNVTFYNGTSAQCNGVKDDNWALIYKLYETNNISIKTPVGLTERRPVERPIITQGDCLGPILASSSVDTFGKDCFQKQKHLYWYREETPVSLLTMLDDVFALSNCGPEATQMQEYINIKTGSKKLQYATDKTFKMHIGKTRLSYKCQDSNIFSWHEDDHTYSNVPVKETYVTKYLGEIISSDGINTKNVSNRKRRRFGTEKEITTRLDNMCLGPVMPGMRSQRRNWNRSIRLSGLVFWRFRGLCHMTWYAWSLGWSRFDTSL